ncbi:MAG TPA: LysR family transcriptional regulator [Albitalea sp.]|nr:LysR family transcriptional regulator [Albitalea sp.]HUG22218.1 LysR family transcriptional regulator [Albitalea sp.]
MSKTLDARALRAFVVAAREGNISRAAERLHLSQPAVSLQLKQLADLTGLDLFIRTSKGVLLTRDGATLLPHAERALQAQADFIQAAERINGSVRGTLRVGTILDPEFTRLGAFLRELVALAPEVRPELHQGMSGQVIAALLKNDLDVGYTIVAPDGPRPDARRAATKTRAADDRLHVEPLTRFTYRVIAPPGWGPQVQGRDWPELVRLPWILTPAPSVHFRLLRDTLEPLGLVQNGVAQVDQESSMLALVRSGVGLSLARDTVAMDESRTNGLVVADKVQLEAVLGFACATSKRSQEAVQVAFAALARAWGHLAR